MSMQPLNHLRIVEPEIKEDKLEYDNALRLLSELSNRINESVNDYKKHSISKSAIFRLIIFLILFILLLFDYRYQKDLTWVLGLGIPMFFLLFIHIFDFYKTFSLKRSQTIEFKKRSGSYFSILAPLSEDTKLLQILVNKSHNLMDVPEYTSWQKIELGVKLRDAENSLMMAREFINKYDSSLLPK